MITKKEGGEREKMSSEIPGQRSEGKMIRNSIVNSLIKRSSTGEIKWDFSRFYDPFDQCLVTAEVNGILFASYDEQSSGLRLEAFKDKELVGRFSFQDAIRLRGILEQLSLVDPVAIEMRKQQAGLDRQAEDRMRIKEAENLQTLGEIRKELEMLGEEKRS